MMTPRRIFWTYHARFSPSGRLVRWVLEHRVTRRLAMGPHA